jgi:DNA modification methylase
MHTPGTATIGDIHPRSEIHRLERNWSEEDLSRRFPTEIVTAVVGMNLTFIARALERPGTRPKTLSLADVLDLLEVDGFQETFVRRSQIPRYLLDLPEQQADRQVLDGRELDSPEIMHGNARDLLQTLARGSVRCAVTSSPYWGMRIYENTRLLKWADGEHCQYGFEQTPEGFIRHTVELLYLLKPALATDGSVWWNLMDTYNTRTPIRGNSRQRLDAMGEVPDSRRGWTEHEACRHSAGHMFLNDAEQCAIPARVAERASRIGYSLKSLITWNKDTSSPEPVRSRVTRQAEYVIHLTPSAKPPLFVKEQWQELGDELGGPNLKLESRERITDVWSLPVGPGKNGHGAEFSLGLPGRCIALSSREGDVILDPFIGSGTTALAALRQNRRCIGFDISESYVRLARNRVAEFEKGHSGRRSSQLSPEQLELASSPETEPPAISAAATKVRRRPARRLPARIGA